MVNVAAWLLVVGFLLLSIVWFLAQTPHGWSLHRFGVTKCDLSYVGESNLSFRYSNILLLSYRTLALTYSLFWMLYTLSNYEKVWFYFTAWSWFVLCIYFMIATFSTLAVIYRCGCSGTCTTLCENFHQLSFLPTLALILQNCNLTNTFVVTIGYWLFVFDDAYWNESNMTERWLSINFHGVNVLLIFLDYVQAPCYIYLRHLSLLLAFICSYTIYLLAEYTHNPDELAYERWDPKKQPQTSIELIALIIITVCIYLGFLCLFNKRFSKPEPEEKSKYQGKTVESISVEAL